MKVPKLTVKKDQFLPYAYPQYKLEIPLSHGMAELIIPYIEPKEARVIKRWIDALASENIDKDKISKYTQEGYDILFDQPHKY